MFYSMKVVGSTALASASQRQHIDMRRPSAPQSFGASFHRGAGGNDVVDDDNPLALDPLFPGRVGSEGPGDIALALLRGEPDLACRRPHALEHEAIDGDATQPAGLLRQQRRLVEPPRPQPRAVERHRNEDIGLFKQFLASFDQPPPEQGQALMPVAIFEALN